MARYVSVAVGFRLDASYTYAVPPDQQDGIAAGMRVLVPFNRRTVTGYVLETLDKPGYEGTIRPILELLDTAPTFTPALMEFLRWAADYYQVPLGELMRGALPPSMHTAEKTRIRITGVGRSIAHTSPLLERLMAGSGELSEKAAVQMIGRVELDRLESVQAVERIKKIQAGGPRAGYRKVVRFVLWNEELLTGPQQRAVAEFIRGKGEVPLAQLLEEKPNARRVVHILEQRGVVIVDKVREYRTLEASVTEDNPPDCLTPEQKEAIEAIRGSVRSNNFESFLIHGVTGSGKTEVYMHCIAQALDSHQGALVLVPEIALTPQLMGLFQARFQERVAVLHSALSPRERYDQWCQVASGRLPIVLGARSAVFAPIANLGLIVVDEEHEPSFKQDERPFYSARDLALVRARQCGATAVLGSATPSLESHHNALAGKHKLLTMPDRATPRPLPDVSIIDLRYSGFADSQQVFSKPLAQAIKDSIDAGDQCILFLNRKGYAAFLLCEVCGAVPQCTSCSISLTYYRNAAMLRCHYCGFGIPLPEECPSCGKEGLKRVGFGTERVVEALREFAPDATVDQLDSTVSASKRLTRVLDRFRNREVDVLVGTQIVAKGHDFPGVTLVGVLMADLGLAFPDFRASERTFQLMTQVAGRAGRGTKSGNVLVQTYLPMHYALQHAQRHDFIGFSRLEMEQRRLRHYPPFSCLSLLRFNGEEMDQVAAKARAGARVLLEAVRKGPVGAEILGPTLAPISVIRNRVRMQVLVKTRTRAQMQQLLQKVGYTLWQELKNPVSVRWSVDVDPINLL